MRKKRVRSVEMAKVTLPDTNFITEFYSGVLIIEKQAFTVGMHGRA